jgi:hypothetical protein
VQTLAGHTDTVNPQTGLFVFLVGGWTPTCVGAAQNFFVTVFDGWRPGAGNGLAFGSREGSEHGDT